MADVVTTWAGVEYWMGDLGSIGTTTWETEWPRGCTVASWELVLPRNASVVNATRIGADVRIYDGPILIWGGYLSEVEASGDLWTFHAAGYQALAENFLAVDEFNVPTSVLSVAVDRAITDGWNVTATGLPSLPLSDTTETVQFNTVRALLDLAADSTGTRWKVDEAGRLTLAADPTTPRWHLDNAEALRSIADDEYVTAVFARYVSAELDGAPTAWGVSPVTTPAPQNLRREEPLDLTPLGLITGPDATTDATNRLALAGVRKGYTSGVEIPFGDLTNAGGAPTRLGHVKAGEMIRAYNVVDTAGIVQIGATQDIVIGRTVYTDGSDTLGITPLGLVPRQLSTILASPQAPPREFEASAVEP